MPTVTLTTTGVFSGYSLSDLRALVLRMLRVSNTVRYSPTSGTADYDWIDDALNRGQDDFVRQTKCLRTYAIVELRANQRTYRLPDDFLDLMAAYYYDSTLSDGYKELSVKTIEELNDDVSDWRTAKGEPARIYVDRQYGAGTVIGLNPIPKSSGDTVTFSSEYGSAVTWVCPLYTFNQDIGVIVRIDSPDEWILPTQAGVSVDADISDGNLFVEYYRLPQIITAQGSNADQYTEIPREYQKALAYYATSDLLSNNPADSIEYKKSMDYMTRFQNEVNMYVNKRKRSLSGRELRARPMVWNWQKNMTYYKEMP